MNLKQFIAYAIYYGIAYHLPENHWVGGRLWNAIRVGCARHLLRECGREVNIDRMVNFGDGSHFTLKDRSGIGANSRIIGDVTFNEDVATAFNIVVTSFDRNLDDASTRMLDYPDGFEVPVVVGPDVVLFAGCYILPGVHVNQGCIVGAGGVVSRDVPPFSVVGGNPARVIKWRKAPGPEAFGPRMTPIACEVPEESRAYYEEAQRAAAERRAAKKAKAAAADSQAH